MMHPNWRRILRKSRTIKLASIAATLQIALPYMQDIIPNGWLALLAIVATFGAIGARLLDNPDTQ